MICFALLLFFLRGIFSGLCGTPTQTLSVIGFEKKELGEINTLFNTFRQISISLRVAHSSALMEAGTYFAKVNVGINALNMSDRFVGFGLGFFAIFLIAIVGAFITRALTGENVCCEKN